MQKNAIKREQSQDNLNSAERELSRPKVKIAIIQISKEGRHVAYFIQQELGAKLIERTAVGTHWQDFDAFVFIGAMGICVRTIAPYVEDKHTDPAVVCVDSFGNHVISVLSGHVGGANELTKQIAGALGVDPVITTQSDNAGLWALDTLATKYNWHTDISRSRMNSSIALFVEKHPTALLLEVRDNGTDYLESTLPGHVKVFSKYDDIDLSQFELLITVGPHTFNAPIPVLSYYPQVLHIGFGCRRQCRADGIAEHIENCLKENGLSPLAIASIGTIELKKDEPLLADLQSRWPWAGTRWKRS